MKFKTQTRFNLQRFDRGKINFALLTQYMLNTSDTPYPYSRYVRNFYKHSVFIPTYAIENFPMNISSYLHISRMQHVLRFLCLLGVLSIYSGLLGQKKGAALPDDIKKARQLVDTYPDEDVYCLDSEDQYTFAYDAQSGRVTVQENNTETFLSLKEKSEYTAVKFYNQESEISSSRIQNAKGKNMPIFRKDDYYNSSDYFYSDAKVHYFQVDFSQLGARRRVLFEKKYLDIKYFTSVYLQDRFPVENKKVTFRVPEWLEVELKAMNFEGYDISLSKQYDAKAKAHVYTYRCKDVAPRKTESNSPGPSHLYPHILILAKSYTLEGERKVLFDSLKDLYGWYKGLVHDMDDDPLVLKDKVAELTKGLETKEDQIKAIYYWVQDNIRYIAFEDGIAGFKPDVCQNVYEKRYGDCKGMANLAKQMLILAGFDARLTWIGTKHIAYDYSLPTLAVDNHMICTVILDGKKYFLDPTQKYNAFSDYAERIQGQDVLIQNGEDYILDQVPQLGPDDNLETIQANLSLEGEQLTGTVSRSYNGESKSDFLYLIKQTQTDVLDDAIQNFLSHGDKNIEATEIKTSNLEDRDQTLTIDYQIDRKNAATSFDDEIYLDLDYEEQLAKFEIEDRESDYLVPHKMKLQVVTSIRLPAGYQVSHLPEGMEEIHPDFSFKVQYKKEGNTLIYSKIFTIDHARIQKKDFDLWNRCIEKLNKTYKQQITLVRT